MEWSKKVNKVFEPKFGLTVIILIAFILRIYPLLTNNYLFGYDPYYHLTYLQESLKHGEWLQFLTFRGNYGSIGSPLAAPLGLYLAPALVYKVLGIFGASISLSFKLTPMIFGLLTIIFFYFAILKFYGKKEAFFSAFFLSVMWGHIFRSMTNYYRGDNYVLFWYSIALLGISIAYKNKSKTKRYIYYLIPGIASGLASIFWKAYYPIFAFLLANAIFLAIGAYIKNKKTRFLDAIAIIGSIIIGSLISITLGSKFGYGMVGKTMGWGRRGGRPSLILDKLDLSLDIIPDAYHLINLKILIPISIGFIILLFLLNKLKRKYQYGILGSITLILLITLFMDFSFLSIDLIWQGLQGFGLYAGELRETHMEHIIPNFNNLFNSYGLVLFLTPLYLIKFFNESDEINFMNLGLILISLVMLTWGKRLLFLSSMAIALMGGLGLVEINKKLNTSEINLNFKGVAIVSVILFLLIPSTSAVLGYRNVEEQGSFMDQHWENALTDLRRKSGKNDVVYTWWDQGHWVFHYARRAPVHQGSLSSFTGRYYLNESSEDYLTRRSGVDYVIVSFKTLRKFGSVVETAGSEKDYSLSVLPVVSSGEELVFQRGNLQVLLNLEQGDVLFRMDDQKYIPKKIWLETNEGLRKLDLNVSEDKKANIYAYINTVHGYSVIMDENSYKTKLCKLMLTKDYNNDKLSLLYSDRGMIRIYELKHPKIGITINQESEDIQKKLDIQLKNGENKEYKLVLTGYQENRTKSFTKDYKLSDNRTIEIKSEKTTYIKYELVDDEVVDKGTYRIRVPENFDFLT